MHICTYYCDDIDCVCLLQYVGLGSALAMGLDAVENSLLGDESKCNHNRYYNTVITKGR